MKSHIYFPLSFIKIKGTKIFKEIAALCIEYVRMISFPVRHRHYSLLVLTVLEQPGPTMAVFEWYIRYWYICMHVLPNLGKTKKPKIGA